MTSQRRIRCGLLLALILLSGGCNSGLVKSLTSVARLQQGLVKKYGDQNINVTINNSTVLVVTFINSPLNTGTLESRTMRALDTALFVKQSYADIANIDELWVNFIKQESKFVVLTYTESVNSFGFDKDAQPLDRVPREFGPVKSGLEPEAIKYVEPDITKVLLPEFELGSVEEDKVTLTVQYTVPGTVEISKPGKAPESVELAFTVTSWKDHVSGESAVEFFSDDKSVFKSLGKYQDGTLPDGRYMDFLAVNISYAQYRRLTSGKTVRFELGNHTYSVTDEQLAALRRMRLFVRE